MSGTSGLIYAIFMPSTSPPLDKHEPPHNRRIPGEHPVGLMMYRANRIRFGSSTQGQPARSAKCICVSYTGHTVPAMLRVVCCNGPPHISRYR